MATKPSRPAPPPPVPKHNAKLPTLHGSQRDSNNNKHDVGRNQPPSRPTVIRPKMVQTPKKKPPPRPPPPKVGSYVPPRTASRQGATDCDQVFGSSKVNSGTSTHEDHCKGTGKLISFSRGQFSLFGSSGKHQRASLRKGSASKRPHTPAKNLVSNKGSAPAPPVPPHRNGTTSGLNFDGTASLISFDSPPPSPAGSRASWSSGVSSQSSGTQPCLLDLDVPPLQPLQDQPWGTTLPHSRTADWGSGPARDTGAGDSAGTSELPWTFPHSGSVPSSLQTASEDSSPSPSWSFPDSHGSPDSGMWDSSRDSWSPPPPLHPPPAPPSLDDSDVETSPLAVAVCNYQADAPGELSFKVQDLIVLLSEDGPNMFRGRCGDEEGLVPKHCVDVLHPLNGVRQVEKTHVGMSPKPKDVSRNTPEGDGGERYCTALYDFAAEGPQELSLRKGDVIRVLGSLNGNWMLGTLRGRKGMFPANFVEVASSGREAENPQNERQPSKGCPVIALHTFQAEQDGDLGFREGDTVTVLSRINKDWLYGELDGRRGQFPASFVRPISGSRSQKGTDCNLYRAIYVFDAQHHDELSLKAADIVDVTQKINDDWWQGRLLGDTSGREGIFPASFVQKMD